MLARLILLMRYLLSKDEVKISELLNDVGKYYPNKLELAGHLDFLESQNLINICENKIKVFKDRLRMFLHVLGIDTS